MNDFLMWAEKKRQIDSRYNKPPFFKEGEIWWCSVGKNIGAEIGGKGELFARPVVILRKLSTTVFIGIPLTTKIKEGTWFYTFFHKDRNITANLSQIRMFDYRRLSTRESNMTGETFAQIKKSVQSLLDL